LAVDVFTIHKLEKKNVLKVIPMLLFLCVFIVLVVVGTSIFSQNYNNHKNKCIDILIVLGVNCLLLNLMLFQACVEN